MLHMFSPPFVLLFPSHDSFQETTMTTTEVGPAMYSCQSPWEFEVQVYQVQDVKDLCKDQRGV